MVLASYITIGIPNQLFGVLVPKVELNILFNIIDTPSTINAPIGLATISASTNDYAK